VSEVWEAPVVGEPESVGEPEPEPLSVAVGEEESDPEAGAVWDPAGALAESVADWVSLPLAEEEPPPAVLLGMGGVEVRVTPTVAQSC